MHRVTSCQINALQETLALFFFSFNVHCVEHYTVHTLYNDLGRHVPIAIHLQCTNKLHYR